MLLACKGILALSSHPVQAETPGKKEVALAFVLVISEAVIDIDGRRSECECEYDYEYE